MRTSAAPFVSLVGAGPGDPGLITVAGLERIRRADVIVYDRLISQSLLRHTREDAELIYVGKTPESERGAAISTDQETINRTLVEKAREGKRVVRLKGGDPFVFGRGGEEAEALRDAAIAFEVVPGVTSAVAVPAYAGIPVTHRGVASSFAVVTGHEADREEGGRRKKEEERGKGAEDETGLPSIVNWEALAQGVDTLVFLMGVKTLQQIVEKLTEAGRSPATPVAVVQQGTTPEQRTVIGTLADIVQRVEEAKIAPPAITVVGDVVRLRDVISWFEKERAGGGLFGKRVLITRTRKQASALAKLLAAEGAIPVELPSIEIQPVEGSELGAAIGRLASGGYDWAVFTSANGVDVFFEALRERGLDARAFGGVRVGAIGPATAQALAARGIVADVVPEEYVAERVVEALRQWVASPSARPESVEGSSGASPARVLIPRAAEAREELPDGLRALGAEVDEVPLYRSVAPSDPPPKALRMLRDGEIDVLTFTSSSTVRNLVSMLDGDTSALEGPMVACIGPITAKTAEGLGLRVDVVATEYTVRGLVEALRDAMAG